MSKQYAKLDLVKVKVKWFQVEQCITNSSLKLQSFVYTQLNDQTVLFLTIQFNVSHLIAHSLNVKHFKPLIEVLLLWAIEDMEVIVMKGYSAFPKSPALLKTFNGLMSLSGHSLRGRVLPLSREAVSIFYKFSQLGWTYR